MLTRLRRLLNWIFRSKLVSLEQRAFVYGKITLQQIELEDGMGWQCSIRPHARAPGDRKPRYAWMANGDTITEALAAAVTQAQESPDMEKIMGAAYAPRLGGSEFDPRN